MSNKRIHFHSERQEQRICIEHSRSRVLQEHLLRLELLRFFFCFSEEVLMPKPRAWTRFDQLATLPHISSYFCTIPWYITSPTTILISTNTEKTDCGYMKVQPEHPRGDDNAWVILIQFNREKGIRCANTRLTDGLNVHTTFLTFLRGFFPLVRDARARSRSSSCASHPCSSSAGALAFLLAAYSLHVSLPVWNLLCNKSKLTSARSLHLGQEFLFMYIQPLHRGSWHCSWCVRQHPRATQQGPILT